MSVFSTEQINRHTQTAEQDFVNEYKCLIDRLALDIIEGVSLYILPSYVIDIRRVTYRGKKIDPISHRDLRESLDGNSASGTPTGYIYNNLGQMTIKLFPIPIESLNTQQTDLLNPSVIRTQCIVEFYTTSDSIGYRLPDYIRKRLLKPYTLKRLFLAEGKGQNLKASKYWSKKWEFMKELFGNQVYDQINTPRRLISNSGVGYRKQFLAQPQLPISMQGIGVDPGE